MVGRGRIEYLVVRLTAVLLAFLVLGHFAFTHIVNDVSETGSSFVEHRWSSVLWLIWDWLLLVTAVVHGGAGAAVAIADYTADRERRRKRTKLLYLVCGFLVIAGTAAIVASA
jgi:succinate dehydrogenase / fumarate reductase, membrane anchor subunit